MNAIMVLEGLPAPDVSLRVDRPDVTERFPAALYGKPDRASVVDRVPVAVQPGLYAMALHGLSSRRFFHEPEAFIRASGNMAAYFGFDWWSPAFDVYNIEAEAMGQPLVWREGAEPWVDWSNPLLRERQDLDRLAPPVPGESGRMPFVIQAYRRFRDLTGVAPVCACCSPLTLAALLRGVKRLIQDMYRDPAWVDRLMGFLSQEVVAPWIRMLAEATGASTVVMCDPFAGPPVLSPSLIRRFWQPHVQAVIQAASSPTCTVLNSAGSCEGHVADSSLIMDVKALEIRPEQWRAGSTVQIVDSVCRALEEAQPAGRFALLLHHIPAGTPVHQVHTAVAAVRQFGRYPLAAPLDRRAFQMPETVPFRQWVRLHGLAA
jgi:uroporphyrinogen-III decarboxylase